MKVGFKNRLTNDTRFSLILKVIKVSCRRMDIPKNIDIRSSHEDVYLQKYALLMMNILGWLLQDQHIKILSIPNALFFKLSSLCYLMPSDETLPDPSRGLDRGPHESTVTRVTPQETPHSRPNQLLSKAETICPRGGNCTSHRGAKGQKGR